jgi:hypothetical protein
VDRQALLSLSACSSNKKVYQKPLVDDVFLPEYVMRRVISKAPAIAGLGLVIAATVIRKSKKHIEGSNKFSCGHHSPHSNSMQFPSEGAPANEADCNEQQQDTGTARDEISTLIPAESIKFDGRAVLCLEVEAAADDGPPFQAQTVDTELLRLLDLLLAVSVLLFCLVTGNLSLDSYTCTVGLAVTAVLASAAVVGLQQYCSASRLQTAATRKVPTQTPIKVGDRLQVALLWYQQ